VHSASFRSTPDGTQRVLWKATWLAPIALPGKTATEPNITLSLYLPELLSLPTLGKQLICSAKGMASLALGIRASSVPGARATLQSL
jgi:hypothetical protein